MEEKIVYRGPDTFFYNSQCLFVEYHDVLAMPWFTMLLFTKNTDAFKRIFKIDEIEDYDIAGLLEWYLYRKHRNVFKNIGAVNPDVEIPDEAFNELLRKAMAISDNLYNINTSLKFLSVLRLLLTDSSMIKQVIIYSENNEPMIETSLNKYFSKFGTKVRYVNGKFADVLSSIPNDSTYVFSDIQKVNDLIKANKLNLSSLLIVGGLRYNYMEDDQTRMKVDLEELSNNYVFKYDFIDNFDLSDMLSEDLLPSEL